MPIPKPNDKEGQDEFISRCMSELPESEGDPKQRLAMCFSQWRAGKSASVVSKARDAAASFVEALNEAHVQEAISEFASELHRMVWVFEEQLAAIGEDPKIMDRKAAAQEMAVGFLAAMGSILGVITASRRSPQAALPRDVASIRIVKVDEDKHLVFGFFNVFKRGDELVVDLQGDVIEADEAERAAYDFVLHARIAGDEHQLLGVGRLVESAVLTRDKVDAMINALRVQGIEASARLGCEAWWGGFKIEDEATWKRIKSGELSSFSIGGWATKEEV